MKLPKSIRGALRSVTMWVNAVALAVLPFADALVIGVQENLPALADYLPVNVFKAIGIAVIAFNIFQRTRTCKSLADKGAP
jgi:phosphopantothenate synthetase